MRFQNPTPLEILFSVAETKDVTTLQKYYIQSISGSVASLNPRTHHRPFLGYHGKIHYGRGPRVM